MKKLYPLFICLLVLLGSCTRQTGVESESKQTSTNPILPLWEYIPDGEPYVFEDPDQPGEMRVYLYGSHDALKTAYCGKELVVWSAPVNDLSRWRYDGVIFESKTDTLGQALNSDGEGDVLYAPDVTLVTDSKGKKTYYLYPNNQNGGRQGMVAKSDRPDGPFIVCNWNPEKANETIGDLRFDPAVFVDDDGKVYGYWGFGKCWGAELDPVNMATIKEGTTPVENMISGFEQEGVFRFFEASSIRKIQDKYVFIYSRWTDKGEFGLHDTNYTLAYAYSNHPLGPFTYGGTIIDARGRDTNPAGDTIYTATVTGNTHGSIIEVAGQWYVFYHRQTGTNEYSRQAMVAPIEVQVTEGPEGKVVISEAEYTSEGFASQGLDPLQRYSAGIACYYTQPQGMQQSYPNMIHSGSYVQPWYADYDGFSDPYDPAINHNPVVNNTSGSVVGYKYFNFDKLAQQPLELLLELKPQGLDATIDILIDSPWKEKGGVKLGSIRLKSDAPQEITEMKAELTDLSQYSGKHALFLVFSSPTEGQSICELHHLSFQTQRH